MANRRPKLVVLPPENKALMDDASVDELWMIVRRTTQTMSLTDDIDVKRLARARRDYARGKIAHFQNKRLTHSHSMVM